MVRGESVERDTIGPAVQPFRSVVMLPGRNAAPRDETPTSFFSQLLLQMIELCLHRGIHPGPFKAAPEQLPFDVGLGTRSSRSLQVSPRRRLCGGRARLGAPPVLLQLLGPLGDIPLRQQQLIALHRHLLLQQRNPLPMPGRELVGDLNRFRIRHRRREFSPALCVDQLLPLEGQAQLGCLQGGPHLAHRHSGVEDGGVKLSRAGAGVVRWSMVGEESLEPGLEPIKHVGMSAVVGVTNGTGGSRGASRKTARYFCIMRRSLILLALVPALGCTPPRTGAACGFTAIAGATMLLQEFGVPDQTLSVPPPGLPPRLVARVAAGPAFEAVVGRTTDSGWVIGVEGTPPEKIRPGFGVLILDPSGRARGVMLYESEPLRGAPIIGKVALDTLMLPLIGIQLDPARFEDPGCPLFPDSVLS